MYFQFGVEADRELLFMLLNKNFCPSHFRTAIK